MAAGRNYNIQTVRKLLASGSMAATRTAVASSVAAGMTRYVTFMRVEANTANIGAGVRLYLVSGAAKGSGSSTATASAGMKMCIELMSNIGQQKVQQLPPRIDTENPLFTIAAGKFLNLAKSRLQLGSGECAVFVQYYDQ